MRDIEKSLINEISVFFLEKDRALRQEIDLRIKKLISELIKLPLGTATPEFLNNSILQQYLDTKEQIAYFFNSNFEELKGWFLIENYLVAKSLNESELEKNKFQAIEAEVKKMTEEISGPVVHLLRLNKPLIRYAYLSNNPRLLQLFSERLPIPTPDFFTGHAIPAFIQKREDTAQHSIVQVIERNTGNIKVVEKAAVVLQRIVRFKNRQRQERSRILHRFRYSIPDIKSTIEDRLIDANTVYSPDPKLCSETLSLRIRLLAKNIRLYQFMRTLTASEHISNIFDEALFGQATLIKFYKKFRKAAMDGGDVSNGDANVICFAPNKIHSNCLQEYTLELVVKLEKLRKNPCLFFKQLDFCYQLTKVRKVVVGKMELYFSHTTRVGSTAARFFLLDKDGKTLARSEIDHFTLISYSFYKLDQILILNFFRFIDRLEQDSRPATALIKSIYSEIESLNDKELTEFLTNIGKALSDTAEFNFYGAHRIDFATINSISDVVLLSLTDEEREKEDEWFRENRTYTLEMEPFIGKLKEGNIKALMEAKEKLPNIFKSYRFVEYLLSHGLPEPISLELLGEKSQFSYPKWMQTLHARDSSKTDLRSKMCNTETSGLKP